MFYVSLILPFRPSYIMPTFELEIHLFIKNYCVIYHFLEGKWVRFFRVFLAELLWTFFFTLLIFVQYFTTFNAMLKSLYSTFTWRTQFVATKLMIKCKLRRSGESWRSHPISVFVVDKFNTVWTIDTIYK